MTSSCAFKFIPDESDHDTTYITTVELDGEGTRTYRPESIVERLNRFSPDPAHQAVRGIPADLAAAMNAALQRSDGWIRAGHVLATYLASRWPHDRVFDDFYDQVNEMMLYSAAMGNASPSYYLGTLIMLWLKCPDLIASVPKEYLIDFVEGASRKFFREREYWNDPINIGA